MPTVVLGVHMILPLFTIRDPASWGVRLSFTLPPPRTIIGALARGLGVVCGFASGEQSLGGTATRNIFTYALESSSFATVRPLSPLIRSSQMLRYVPPVETAGSVTAPQDAHDAFKTYFMFTDSMKAIYVIDVNSVNKVFGRYGLPEIDVEMLDRGANFVDRIGQTESFCHVKNVERLEIEGEDSTVNTYFPLDWLERAAGDYYVGELLPNLRVLERLRQIECLDIGRVQDKDLRRRKIPYLLPLRATGSIRGKEVLEPAEVQIVPKAGYSSYLLSDKTKIVLPSQGETDIARSD
jgi:CRISPR-associated protein Cas5 subtype I-A